MHDKTSRSVYSLQIKQRAIQLSDAASKLLQLQHMLAVSCRLMTATAGWFVHCKYTYLSWHAAVQ